MATIIFSDQMTQPYSEWLTDGLQAMAEKKPKTIAIVAICEDGEALTGYWNSTCEDKAMMAQHIQADYIDQLTSANFAKYLEEHNVIFTQPDDEELGDSNA